MNGNEKTQKSRYLRGNCFMEMGEHDTLRNDLDENDRT